MDLTHKVVEAMSSEAASIAEALESLEARHGVTLKEDAALMLRGWVQLHSNIGLTLVTAKIAGASAKVLEGMAEVLHRSTITVLADHFRLMLIHSNVPEAKHEEVIKFVMTYYNRAVTTVIDTVHAELRKGGVIR